MVKIVYRELEEKKELALMQEHNYASLQEEVEAKTKKLKKVYQKYQEAQSEIQVGNPSQQ